VSIALAVVFAQPRVVIAGGAPADIHRVDHEFRQRTSNDGACEHTQGID
jgi:hypothetical protein